MNPIRVLLSLALTALTAAAAPVRVDVEKLGQALGGWAALGGRAAQYEISGSRYRTFKPAVSTTPDGGLFVSVRIDNVRGMFSANDHASLEITFGPDGAVVSAQSSISLQGKKVTSDVITTSADAGKALTAVDQALVVGTKLMGSLTEKMSRENVVEPGRVTFPAVVKHNYNILCVNVMPPEPIPVAVPAVEEPARKAPDAGTRSAE